jgi:hypothetical protein
MVYIRCCSGLESLGAGWLPARCYRTAPRRWAGGLAWAWGSAEKRRRPGRISRRAQQICRHAQQWRAACLVACCARAAAHWHSCCCCSRSSSDWRSSTRAHSRRSASATRTSASCDTSRTPCAAQYRGHATSKSTACSRCHALSPGPCLTSVPPRRHAGTRLASKSSNSSWRSYELS